MERRESVGVSVAEMALFPLNVVLFPHMPFSLHIFEERYKEMVNRCIQERCTFGIILLSDDDSVSDEETHRIGCAARISHVERLADGRMNIMVIGEERFRILDTHESRPYRTGLIVPVTDTPSDASTVVPLADEVQRLLKDFLTRSLALAGQPREPFELPDEPEQLSFTAACVLPIDNEEKQALLEDTDTAARLQAEREILRREVVKLRRAAAAQSAPEPVSVEQYAAFRCSN